MLTPISPLQTAPKGSPRFDSKVLLTFMLYILLPYRIAFAPPRVATFDFAPASYITLPFTLLLYRFYVQIKITVTAK